MSNNKNKIEESTMSDKTTEVKKDTRPSRQARKALYDVGKLKFRPIPGYHLRVVSTDEKDHAGRLHRFKELDWEPVLRKEQYGENCDRPNEPVRIHGSFEQMLMKIPDEFYEEDQKEKVRRNKENLKSKLKNKEHEHGSFHMDTRDSYE